MDIDSKRSTKLKSLVLERKEVVGMGLEELRQHLRRKTQEKPVSKKLPDVNVTSKDYGAFHKKEKDVSVVTSSDEKKEKTVYYRPTTEELVQEWVKRRQMIDDAAYELKQLQHQFQDLQSEFDSYQLSHNKIVSDILNSDYENMDGVSFEKFCKELLTALGFENVEMTPKSGDDGVDLVGYRDDVKYVFQCKRYKKNVGRSAVQEVYTGKSVYDADVAIVISTAEFTKDAKSTANKLHVKLWNGEKIKDLNLRIRKHKEWLDSMKK